MKKICFLVLSCFMLSSAAASGILHKSYALITSSTYPWSLPAPGAITLYKNISKNPVSFVYTTDKSSDTVVIRCPLNDIVLQANYTYVCWLPSGESAKIELKPYYFRNGASGTYSLIF
ncbi:hypothetical protein [Legionella pneumophila]|uniref:Uncharacterized protein n=1 Tax=Legionella pneumophila subsp. pascullei TaxID=91890 RepID=A0AAX2IWY7_LEGPN|nr:hypothetical protein [Legionella pneumophila]AMP89258.1 hypothetical protein AXF35_05995 [Legionella pneumophila subsp. pascullei]AMP93074.1 hypothetical protein AXF36_10795 [Legionella pneumophila subsp. pascullei]AMP96040.1 hypothetical protein AXF37_10685 [Legionella pneumophila subsp. pascullei]SQG90977.1 Uncharacterised protein [Legionella pneumophila subsp. pascullei]VEH07522.1 Uncharacterised protein [Legionella pneumophila subsp. pascullei]